MTEIPVGLIVSENLADVVCYFTNGTPAPNSDTAVLIDAILERTDKPLDRGIWNIEDNPNLPAHNPRLHRWMVWLMLMPEFQGVHMYSFILRWVQQDPELSTQVLQEHAQLHSAFYTHQISSAIVTPRNALHVGTHILGAFWKARCLRPRVSGESAHNDIYATRLFQLLFMIAPWLPEVPCQPDSRL